MALARVALKNLQERASVCKNYLLGPYFINNCAGGYHRRGVGLGVAQEQGWSYGLLHRMSSSATSDGGKEVAVKSENDDESGNKKSRWKSLLPRSFSRSRPSLWKRNDTRDPFENFPVPGLGSALMEAAENMNRLFDNAIPSQIMGRFKETEDSYKLRYDMPGLSHGDIKVTIDDGVLRIRGERKVEEGDEAEDEHWMSYGYYNTSFVLPDDAKQDDIKAELKDGVLKISIPKTESQAKDVKEIEIQLF